MVSFWTESLLTFWSFMKKNPCKKKKVRKNCFDKQEKSRAYLKILQKKHKIAKAILTVLCHSKSKIFSVGQPRCPTFFPDLGPPTILVLLRPWLVKKNDASVEKGLKEFLVKNFAFALSKGNTASSLS